MWLAIGSKSGKTYATGQTRPLLFQELQKKYPSTHQNGNRKSTNRPFIFEEGGYLYILKAKE
jgi:hypothetical protein